MKFRQLQFFAAVAEELNFSRAAVRLHVAQPSLSTQIRMLEEEVGARLFERDKRHVSLTSAGKRFETRVAGILALANTAKTEARLTEAGEFGTIDVGYTALSMFSTALPQAIRQFKQLSPNVLLAMHELTSLEQLHRIGERTLDLGVLRRVKVKAPPGIRITEWYRTRLVAAIASDHRCAKNNVISLTHLKDDPHIMYPRGAGTGIYWQVLDLCARAGFRPRVVREVLESSTIIGLVAAGVGVAIVPADMSCIEFSGVTYKPLVDAHAYSSLYLAQRDTDTNKHLIELCSVLKRLSARRENG